jgi:hypothetical protein
MPTQWMNFVIDCLCNWPEGRAPCVTKSLQIKNVFHKSNPRIRDYLEFYFWNHRIWFSRSWFSEWRCLQPFGSITRLPFVRTYIIQHSEVEFIGWLSILIRYLFRDFADFSHVIFHGSPLGPITDTQSIKMFVYRSRGSEAGQRIQFDNLYRPRIWN